jgi:hypothetical protein
MFVDRDSIKNDGDLITIQKAIMEFSLKVQPYGAEEY